MVLGSEGSFGVITQATLKIKPAPEVKQYGEYYLGSSLRLRSRSSLLQRLNRTVSTAILLSFGIILGTIDLKIKPATEDKNYGEFSSFLNSEVIIQSCYS
jgi:hypothetical protein